MDERFRRSCCRAIVIYDIYNDFKNFTYQFYTDFCTFEMFDDLLSYTKGRKISARNVFNKRKYKGGVYRSPHRRGLAPKVTKGTGRSSRAYRKKPYKKKVSKAATARRFRPLVSKGRRRSGAGKMPKPVGMRMGYYNRKDKMTVGYKGVSRK